MAVGTQYTDLSDLRTGLLNVVREATGDTATNNIADRLLNVALHDIHIDPGHSWPWSIRRAYLLTHAPYTTGTVDITAAARTTVTGTSTLWNTTVTGMGFTNARVGGKMTFSGSNEVYEVSAVGSDTSITLVNRWTGAALDDATYAYFEDEYALATDFLRPLDMRNFSTDANIPFVGPMEFRRGAPRNSRRQRPQIATWFQSAFSSTTTPQYRVRLWPAPDDEYSIPYDYITSYLAVTSAGVEQAQMTNTTDEPIIPLAFRHILVLHAAYNWYRDRKDDTRSAEVKAEYVDLMNRMVGTSNIGQDRPRFSVNYMKYFGGRRLGRFDSSTAFDELRDRGGYWRR